MSSDKLFLIRAKGHSDTLATSHAEAQETVSRKQERGKEVAVFQISTGQEVTAEFV